MRGAWGACVAMVAAALAGCGCNSAFANEAAIIEHWLVFGGADSWSGGGFAHAGFIWAVDGVMYDGFAVKVFTGAGQYRYLNGSTPTTGDVAPIDVLPGWHIKRGEFDVSAFVGVDTQTHRVSPFDPGNGLAGTHTGVRAALDVWWQPTPDAMVSANISYASIGNGYWARVSSGWRVFDLVYVGPEVHAMGDEVYHQWRLGLHATALHIGMFEVSAGAGYVEDNSGRAGFYSRFGMLLRR